MQCICFNVDPIIQFISQYIFIFYEINRARLDLIYCVPQCPKKDFYNIYKDEIKQ